MFFDKHVYSFMSRIPIILKFKMCLFLDEVCSWDEKLFTDTNLLPLMPDEDNNFGVSLVLDFREWWRHVQPKNKNQSRWNRDNLLCLIRKKLCRVGKQKYPPPLYLSHVFLSLLIVSFIFFCFTKWRFPLLFLICCHCCYRIISLR